MKHRWKSICIALLIVLAGGAARLPMEQAYTNGMRQAGLLETPLNLSMRDELGQSLFIAVLGGFRSVVASIMELKAITPWQLSNWGVVDELYSICTRLQPREVHYWETRAWHLAVNARDTYMLDSMLTEANRHALAQQYVEKGISVVREGLQYNPGSWKLWDRLGYYQSMPYNENPDHAEAADSFAKASGTTGALKFLWRKHVYEVARTTGDAEPVFGREVEAWDKLLALYNSGDGLDRTPSVEVELIRLYLLFSDKHPEFKLPWELYRLITDPRLIIPPLSPAEKKRSALLLEYYERRIHPGPRSRRQAPPNVSSPGVPKLR
jgi:hypothetical protein